MNKVLRWLVTKVYGPIVLQYLKKDRYYHYKGLRLLVKQGVFHPAFFFSTKFLLAYLSKQQVTKLSVLELGAGSGLVSFYLAQKGANVIASDISTVAIQGLLINKQELKLPVQIIQSDLFDNIPTHNYDYIIINPPYYPALPKNEAEMAWFCGVDFEYFEKLFTQLVKAKQRNTIIIMSLSEDCNIQKIIEIANKSGLDYKLIWKKRIMGELNYIYQIVSK
jgi:release factor glutamine methyltransferase